jgi:hypothetical protein
VLYKERRFILTYDFGGKVIQEHGASICSASGEVLVLGHKMAEK